MPCMQAQEMTATWCPSRDSEQPCMHGQGDRVIAEGQSLGIPSPSSCGLGANLCYLKTLVQATA